MGIIIRQKNYRCKIVPVNFPQIMCQRNPLFSCLFQINNYDTDFSAANPPFCLAQSMYKHYLFSKKGMYHPAELFFFAVH